MSEFKGTKGKFERVYVNGICIGIGTVGQIRQMTANSVIDHIETDEEYELEREEIEANMLIYSKAPEMLEMLKQIIEQANEVVYVNSMGASETYFQLINQAEELIKEATQI